VVVVVGDDICEDVETTMTEVATLREQDPTFENKLWS
jgi:hypothetical protein